MSKLPDIAVIIPIFEEQDSIQRVLSDLEITVGTAGKIYLGDIGIPKTIYDQVKEGSRPKFEEGTGLLKVQ